MKDLSLLTNIEDSDIAFSSILNFDSFESFKDFAPYIKYVSDPQVLQQLINRMEEWHRNDNTGNKKKFIQRR